MTEHKFSPGSWKVGTGEYSDRITAGDPPLTVAEVWYGSRTREQQRANARLIATAPELYGACAPLPVFLRDVADFIHSLPGFGPTVVALHIKADEIEKVVAKAVAP